MDTNIPVEVLMDDRYDPEYENNKLKKTNVHEI